MSQLICLGVSLSVVFVLITSHLNSDWTWSLEVTIVQRARGLFDQARSNAFLWIYSNYAICLSILWGFAGDGGLRDSERLSRSRTVHRRLLMGAPPCIMIFCSELKHGR